MTAALAQAHDVLQLKGELIGELVAEVERLRVANEAHEARRRSLSAELKAALEREEEQRRFAELQSTGLQQARTEAARTAKRHAQEAKRREESLTARATAAEEALRKEAAHHRSQLEQKDAALRTAQAQARALQRRLDNAQLTKRNDAFVSQSTHATGAQPPAPWLAGIGGGTPPSPPDLAMAELPLEGAASWPLSGSSGGRPTPETIAPAAPNDEQGRGGQVSLAQQQRDFIERLNAGSFG